MEWTSKLSAANKLNAKCKRPVPVDNVKRCVCNSFKSLIIASKYIRRCDGLVNNFDKQIPNELIEFNNDQIIGGKSSRM
ncbi:unnamed protein product [Rotaria sp. Silwood1]|nr:unnamed protein product [Rotaria sp. Silwood1]